ncbi:MAG: ribonuclease D [Anaerolineaceae bacterium]|nr:MAG: ribonuclease D [Anaerolineaceae bacterium]
MPELPPPVWVATSARLQSLVADLARQPRLAVDTESNSLHAYREQVCLIQFSTPDTDYLVDPLILADLSPLAPIFSDPKIEKVFHAVEYDLVGLKRDFGFEIVSLFDTMQSARILGYPQVGLDALLGLKFGLKVDKRFQKADWGQRPLPPDRLNYARLDTRHLLPLRDLLQVELEAAGRWDLAREEFIRLAQPNGNGRPEASPRALSRAEAWQRVANTQKFTGPQLAVLKELCDWREIAASRMDRPPFKVVDDKRLTAIALTAPESTRALDEFLTPHQARRFGTEILRAVARGRRAAPLERPCTARPNGAFLLRMDLLNQWRKHSAQKLHIESDLILPRGWMHAIAEKNPQTVEELAALMPASPWRLEKFGEEILKTIAPKIRKTGD